MCVNNVRGLFFGPSVWPGQAWPGGALDPIGKCGVNMKTWYLTTRWSCALHARSLAMLREVPQAIEYRGHEQLCPHLPTKLSIYNTCHDCYPDFQLFHMEGTCP